MRAQLLLLLLFVVAALTIGASFFTAPPPQGAALDFLAALRQGDFRQALAAFGDNTCNCPPRGGFKSYLRYESGLENNIACLLGTPFQIGSLTVRHIPDNQPYVIPWERPQSSYVDVDLSFPDKTLFFLPLELAFGKNMSPEAFAAFLANPGRNFAPGFPLRLRTSIKPGLVGKADELPAKPGVPYAKVLFPADCANVLANDGKAISQEELESKLPRLAFCRLRLKVVRRGYLSPWKIAKCKFEKARLEVGQKTVPLTLTRPGSPDLDL